MINFERERAELLISFIEEIFDYCINKKFRRPEATERDVAFFVLITDMLEVARSVCILYDNESRFGGETLIRVLVEKSLFLKLIGSNSKFATSFLLSLQIHNLDLIQRVESGDDFAKSLARKLNIDLSQLQENIKNRFSREKDAERRTYILKSYEECFEFDISKKKLTRLDWFNLDGHTTSIYEVSKKVGDEDSYQTMYRSFSTEVHSSTLSQSYKFISEKEKTILG